MNKTELLEKAVSPDDSRPVDTNVFFTIPNILTLIRILLIPLFMYIYIVQDNYMTSAVIVFLSGFTDIADGFIARHFHMISAAGKVLDPVADKLTQAAVLLCLLSRFDNMIYALSILIVCELLVLVIAVIIFAKKNLVRGAAWHGKMSSALLFAMMAIHLVWIEVPAAVSNLSIIICCGMMIISSILYVIRFIRIMEKY